MHTHHWPHRVLQSTVSERHEGGCLEFKVLILWRKRPKRWVNGERKAKIRLGNGKSWELARSHTWSTSWLVSVLLTFAPVLLPSCCWSFSFFSAHYSTSVCPLSHCFPHKRIPWIHWALSVHWLHVSRSGIPLKFTRTRSFTRQQPISRHPDQTIRWAHHASIPPWVIVGVLPTWPAMTCSVSEGQSF